MGPRRILFVAALLGGLYFFADPTVADQPVTGTPGDKALVTDGHVFHDAGDLQNHVTNWGLIGSRPTQPTSFNLAPSARWGGVDYLWSAGVWVGGTVLGETLVSTGQFASEIMASEAPGDTIFATAQGAPGGIRYPWSGADDDGDGAEDEDPLDGLDNDGDGLVDEDFAACADQQFRCAMRDDTPLAVDIYPDHVPMNLVVVQESYQWSDPLAREFIGYEYQVTNDGVVAVDGVHLGLFADFDILASDDDLVGSWVGLVEASNGASYPVSVGYAMDGALGGGAPGYAGFVLCGIETDAAAGAGPEPLAMHSFNRFSGNVSFEQGGDPTNDSERYQLLHEEGRDPDPQPLQTADYRFLVSTPEVPSLAPGETVIFRFALVVGADLGDLLTHAGEAVATAQGAWFDRDGDPANGDEFHVPWLRPEDVPVPAVGGKLQALTHRGSVSLAFDVRNLVGGGAVIDRRPGDGIPARTWPVDVAAGNIVDDDAVGWPRTYDLVVKSAGSEDLVLDTVVAEKPPLMTARVAAYPNPFNPRLNISYSLPEAGQARLEILDVQGRVVDVLFDEVRSGGEGSTVWNGIDSGGREVASGVYLVRLVSTRETVLQRVTLLR